MVKCQNCKALIVRVRVEEKPVFGASRRGGKARFGVCPRCQTPVVSEFVEKGAVFVRIRALLTRCQTE